MARLALMKVAELEAREDHGPLNFFEIIERIFPGHMQGLVKRFAALTTEEQQQLAYLCKKLGTVQPT